MIAIRVELLSGTYHASDHTLRSPEWPPHPDRVFQAMVAALHHAENSPELRELFLAIESASWSIAASHASNRPSMVHYVPRNEDQGGGRGSYNPAFATERMKERRLPACEPHNPVVHYSIDADIDIASLGEVVHQVSRLGRSPVAMTVLHEMPPANWVPTQGGGELMLRVPYSGRLADLEAAYDRGTRARTNWGHFRRADSERPLEQVRGEFAELIILAASARGVDVTRVAPLVEMARRSILSLCEDPLPEWLAGHSRDGAPLQASHLGITPTISCGPHGDGRVMGLGLLVPKEIASTESRERLQPVLRAGLSIADQNWHVENSRAMTTAPATWTRPARRWASATPLEIRRRDRRPAIEIAAEWADRSGLPEPSLAQLRPEPFVRGPVHACRYAQGKRPRLRMHAVVEWEQPIAGPVVLGMGRYRGFGLMRPFDERS